ncbi:U2 snRNA/tRNA pseudouridine synthase, putative [Plasmodium vivax]|uniref:U2 snRNA/tRNA pseudouridine synthase, putative n=1 Tax=Plasmodium vivax TaxID=5855 RepID=A0A1G4GR08_PLAVI|nr:U2 snRNA/tRNA pseudouridine synthase, putative [Plasmodium vivax]
MNNYQKNKERIKRIKLEGQKRRAETGETRETEEARQTRERPPNLKKYALCVGYVGSRYHGCQGQGKDCMTIENEIERTLIKMNAVGGGGRRKNFNFCQSRSARTDLGVHALYNVFVYQVDLSCGGAVGGGASGGAENVVANGDAEGVVAANADAASREVATNEATTDEAAAQSATTNEATPHSAALAERTKKEKKFRQLLNEHLPEDIRCFDMHRVTKSFDARKFCSFRLYEYLFPVCVLSEVAVRDEYRDVFGEALQVIEGRVEELRRGKRRRGGPQKGGGEAAQQSGGDVAAAQKGADEVAEETGEDDAAQQSGGDDAAAQKGADEVAEETGEDDAAQQSGGDDAAERKGEDYSTKQTTSDDAAKGGGWDDILTVKARKEELTEEELNAFFEIVQSYAGYHNFHCFTKSKAEQTTFRFIKYLEVSTVNLHEYNFVSVQILGQSFLMHQIRKMLTLSVETFRKATCVNSIYYCLNAGEYVPISLFPAEGLMLICPFFNAYNEKVCNPPQSPPICFEESEEVLRFKRDVVAKCIVEQMRKDVWNDWVLKMNRRPFVYHFMRGRLGDAKPSCATAKLPNCQPA